MTNETLIIAAADTLTWRLGVFAVASVVGAILIFVGLNNIKTQVAEESGKRRLTNKLFGISNTYTGSKAVQMGWIRVVCGVGVIIFGVVLIFVGPFLKDKANLNISSLSLMLAVGGGLLLIGCLVFGLTQGKNKRRAMDGIPCQQCGRVNAKTTKVCPRCMAKL